MADLNTCIRGAQIKDGTITASELASDAVTTVKILDANITAGKLATDAVETVKIKNANVTAAKLATDSVETAKIKAKNVTLAKVEDMGLEAHLLVANATLRPVSVAMSGDITITALGVTSIGADKVTKTEIASDIAGDGLKQAAGGELDLDLNELTAAVVDVSADSIAIIDGTASKKESIADLVAGMAGSGLTASNGQLSADAVSDNIIEGDIQRETEAGDDSTVVFNLTFVPIANSVQVYQRGLLVEEGSGKDFTLNAGAKTVTFATAPLTGDVIQVYYIIDN